MLFTVGIHKYFCVYCNTDVEDMSMYEYRCRRCGCMMDPGEGRNGVCDDCVTGETERQRREEELDRMIRATNFKQMEMEDILK